ncbi:SdpI family protein [bacterium]|nr:SdpI family protein [bacterium]
MEDETTSGMKQVLTAGAYILFIMLVLTVVGWINIPDGQRIVTHWNIKGQPDAYSSKAVGLLGLPVVTLVLTGIFVLLARIERLSFVKTIIWIAAMMPLVVLQGLTVWVTLGRKADVSAILWGTFGLLLIVIGNYFPKLRQNRISGIRTPWTLSSELSWNKTHRIGGKLTVLYGLLILLCAFFLDSVALLYVIIAAGLPWVLFLFIYSYVIWKGDPGRSPSSI